MGRHRQADIEAATAMLQAGASVEAIKADTGVGRTMITRIRRDLGMTRIDTSHDAVARRRAAILDMADEGYTSEQIAARVGIGAQHVRDILQLCTGNRVLAADKAARRGKPLDGNRIVERIVMDAENLAEGFGFVDLRRVDIEKAPAWVVTLRAARRAIKEMEQALLAEHQRANRRQEKRHEGTAATDAAVLEGPPRPDPDDAGPDGGDHAAAVQS
jgi:transposase